MATYEFLNGDKLYQKRARKILPILVRQAKAGQIIYYSDLAKEVGIPNPRNLNYPLGFIANALKQLSKEWGIEIPKIQCVVVNKHHGVPGEGFDWGIKKKKLNSKQKKEIINRLLSEVFSFDRWDDVLLALGLSPMKYSKNIIRKITKASTYGVSGESDEHKSIKNKIANHPDLIGIKCNDIKEIYIEYILPSMDKIDILFETNKDLIGVEVKAQNAAIDDILRGLYQCVKYQALLEAHTTILEEYKNVKVILALGGTFPNELLPIKNLLGIEVIDNITI